MSFNKSRAADREYVIHTDAGHAWVAVPLKTLVALACTRNISAYSYIKGKTAYLEEDCDFEVFVKAFELTFSKKPAFRYAKHYDGLSPIRSYERFTMEKCLRSLFAGGLDLRRKGD